jgi:hypothetical protein
LRARLVERNAITTKDERMKSAGSSTHDPDRASARFELCKVPFDLGELEPHHFQLTLAHCARRGQRPLQLCNAPTVEVIDSLAQVREVGGVRPARGVHAHAIGRGKALLESE